MAFTEAQKARLEKVIATGAQRVQYADRTVTYRSLAELKEILEDVEGVVDGTVKIRHIRVNSSKGFGC